MQFSFPSFKGPGAVLAFVNQNRPFVFLPSPPHPILAQSVGFLQFYDCSCLFQMRPRPRRTQQCTKYIGSDELSQRVSGICRAVVLQTQQSLFWLKILHFKTTLFDICADKCPADKPQGETYQDVS